MPSEPRDPNALLPLGGVRSTRPGDLPDPIRRRYYLEDRGREWRLFVDARSKSAVIEDRGRRLLTRRSDPNSVCDMARIAEHRGWRTVEARGSRTFRREAWLAGRSLGLEVRGYRPTERDLQELDRRQAREPGGRRPDTRQPQRRRDGGATDRLQVVEAVVRSRVPNPEVQARLIEKARARIAEWLERGARFDRFPTPDHRARTHEPHERRRAR
jgi:hypothetical protein